MATTYTPLPAAESRKKTHHFHTSETPKAFPAVPAATLAGGAAMSDLFSSHPAAHHIRGERRLFPAADVLHCVAFEGLVVVAAGVSLLAGEPFTEDDRARLVLAVSRIQAAITAGGLTHE